jgi:ATP-dependent Clp protease ATP-binding subunit ClpX
LPEDLIKFGLIPEFIGRLPVVGAVQQLDRDMLISVLTEPKNSLVRQYQAAFLMDEVDLRIEPAALAAVADLALERGTGARGLRSILEDVLLNVMFDLPGRSDVATCVITEDVVRKTAEPIYELRKPARTRRAS